MHRYYIGLKGRTLKRRDNWTEAYCKDISRNQIKKGTVSQSYLFAGTRGTGKTTTARIPQKAVNCTCSDPGAVTYRVVSALIVGRLQRGDFSMQ